MNFSGHCMCGKISYECGADPAFTAICHCKTCQRQTGTFASVVVGVPNDSLMLSGDTLATFVTKADSGANTRRSFCTACGSPIVTRSDAIPGLAVLKAGTLNDTSGLAPAIEIWVEQAQRWTKRLEGTACFTQGF